jgi:acyl carrier protein
MTPDEIQAVVIRCIRRVAPEVEPDEIEPEEPLRAQLDIDSMDQLNIVIGIHKELGIEIPEEDYPRLMTLSGTVAYLDEAMKRRGLSTSSS